jgi:transcriptional regulator with XRE-family HTH domain
MDLREVFAINLRRLRNARGMSQEGLAHEARISRSYLSQIEKGSFNVSLKVIGKLAETLHVEPGEFLNGRIQGDGVSKTLDINLGSEEEV